MEILTPVVEPTLTVCADCYVLNHVAVLKDVEVVADHVKSDTMLSLSFIFRFINQLREGTIPDNSMLFLHPMFNGKELFHGSDNPHEIKQLFLAHCSKSSLPKLFGLFLLQLMKFESNGQEFQISETAIIQRYRKCLLCLLEILQSHLKSFTSGRNAHKLKLKINSSSKFLAIVNLNEYLKGRCDLLSNDNMQFPDLLNLTIASMRVLGYLPSDEDISCVICDQNVKGGIPTDYQIFEVPIARTETVEKGIQAEEEVVCPPPTEVTITSAIVSMRESSTQTAAVISDRMTMDYIRTPRTVPGFSTQDQGKDLRESESRVTPMRQIYSGSIPFGSSPIDTCQSLDLLDLVSAGPENASPKHRVDGVIDRASTSDDSIDITQLRGPVTLIESPVGTSCNIDESVATLSPSVLITPCDFRLRDSLGSSATAESALANDSCTPSQVIIRPTPWSMIDSIEIPTPATSPPIVTEKKPAELIVKMILPDKSSTNVPMSRESVLVPDLTPVDVKEQPIESSVVIVEEGGAVLITSNIDKCFDFPSSPICQDVKKSSRTSTKQNKRSLSQNDKFRADVNRKRLKSSVANVRPTIELVTKPLTIDLSSSDELVEILNDVSEDDSKATLRSKANANMSRNKQLTINDGYSQDFAGIKNLIRAGTQVDSQPRSLRIVEAVKGELRRNSSTSGLVAGKASGNPKEEPPEEATKGPIDQELSMPQQKWPLPHLDHEPYLVLNPLLKNQMPHLVLNPLLKNQMTQLVQKENLVLKPLQELNQHELVPNEQEEVAIVPLLPRLLPQTKEASLTTNRDSLSWMSGSPSRGTAGRRKGNYWRAEEELELISLLDRYGTSWANIRRNISIIDANRDEKDIRDKYRSLVKAKRIEETNGQYTLLASRPRGRKLMNTDT